MRIRPYLPEDLPAMLELWNEVVREGEAFPQEEELTPETGAAFFASQSCSAVAEAENGTLPGLYILHPNNVGRCGHICNASFAVGSASRGRGTGEALVRDCVSRAASLGFRIMQFNAVVEGNLRARRLYERLGFRQLGTIPGGFRRKDGAYVNICPYYLEL